MKKKQPEEIIREELIMNFGYAYKAFGLTKLMGHVVALLISSSKPMSLDEIADKLGRSKGPISQITRRLRDKNLIRRVWQPTSRKDFYEIQPEIFENAFRNNMDLIRNNLKLARQFEQSIKKMKNEDLDFLKERIHEMKEFYQLMDKYYNDFLTAWEEKRNKLVNK